MKEKVTRTTVWFTGKVQRVGFRYETLNVAKAYDVSGSVENLLDGRVLLRAEGESSEVKSFIDAVKEALSDYIRESSEHSDEGPRTVNGFQIQR